MAELQVTMNFYKSAALVLDHLEKHQGSVKGSLGAAGVQASGGEAKRILALVIETLKYKPTLLQLLTTVPVRSLEKLTFPRKTPPKTPSSASLLLVLTHDLLFTPRGIQASASWPPKLALTRHQARLKAELVRLQLKAGAARKEDLARASGGSGEVRYVRWNPNIDLHREGDWSFAALERHLEIKGLKRVEEAEYPVPPGRWFFDPHLPDCLLAFEGSSTWWVGDEWYEAGAVILQDKASCFPAKVLMEGWKEKEGSCIDATAAPGNKTSYISALMPGSTSPSSKIIAFERSPTRFKTLERLLSNAECKDVLPRRADFLESDPKSDEFAGATRILLDPSCSGSGIVNRLDYLLEDAEVDEPEAQASRLEKLAAFQLQMILHAFKFPSAQRIVYSTCSIHAEEDEQVVFRALQLSGARDGGWTLAPRSEVLPSWERRGRASEMGGSDELADSVLRCLPREDKTNGFFVACFVRGQPPASAAAIPGKRKRGIEDESLYEQKGGEGPSGPISDITRSENVVGDEAVEIDIDDAPRAPSSGLPPHDKQLVGETKAKTAAQLERARRKKAVQKRRKLDGVAAEASLAP